jgi:hypothetical protein
MVEVLATYSHSMQAADLRLCTTMALTNPVGSPETERETSVQPGQPSGPVHKLRKTRERERENSRTTGLTIMPDGHHPTMPQITAVDGCSVPTGSL